MNDFISIYIQAFGLGLLMSLPFGAAAELIIRKAYFEKFETGVMHFFVPILIDVICFFAVALVLIHIQDFINEYDSVIKRIVGVLVFLIGAHLFFVNSKSGNHSEGNIFKIASINFVTSPFAFGIFLQNFASGNLILSSGNLQILFAAGFLSGAIILWMTTLTMIDTFRDWLEKHFNPERLKKNLACMVMLAGTALFVISFLPKK